MLNQRYEIIEEIGAGGMGKVYKARDTQTGALVAIKQLQAMSTTLQPEILERFKREGDILRQLNHPNIVTWLDTIEVGMQPYLVMEYIHGGDLHDLLNEGLPPLTRTLNIALDIADALTRTHRLNIVHRDLKPANVLIAEDGTPRLTDFGLAREVTTSQLTRRGSVIGTLYYLPPELIHGEEASPLADIWSFGVMLFQMVTGELPFFGNSQGVVLKKILNDPIPDIEALQPNIPVAFADLIYRMLNKDKNCRIPSVRLVGAELETLLKQANLPLELAQTDMTGYEGSTLIISAADSSRFAEPTPSTIPHNLPANLMPFVGREAELTSIEALLQDSDKRLISIVGIGGMGKTRLALEIALRQLHYWPKGVFIVDLAPLTETAEILNAIASALSFQFYEGPPPLQQLIDFLQDKAVLLVLDNFEHLLEAVPTIDAILRDVADLKIIITSRERLNLQYEAVFGLAGFEVEKWTTVEEALQTSSLQLFLQSARRADPSFEANAENIAAIQAICVWVEGLPLGILLAAGWVNLLSPLEIVDELKQSADFLETELHNIPERHRSLRTVFAYSWQLLNEAERHTFSQLAVFRGGFTREAAQKITGTNLRTLLSLVNKSLIQRSPDGRFAMHAILHQYAYEELTKLEQAETLKEAHSTYFLGRLKAREPDSRGGKQLKFSQDVSQEWANVVAAWHWAIDHKHSQILLDCVFVMHQYLQIRNAWWIAQPLYEYSLAGLDGRLETALDHALWVVLKYDAAAFTSDGRATRNLADELCPLAEKYPVPPVYKILLRLLRGSFEDDRTFLENVYAEAQATHDQWLVAQSLMSLGYYARFNEQNLADSQAFYQQALQIALRMGNAVTITRCYNQLGQLASIEEDYQAGIDYYKKAIALSEQFGDRTTTADFYNNLALETMLLGNYPQAIEYAQKGLAIHQELGNHVFYMVTQDTLANIYYLMGDYARAEQLLQQCIEMCRQYDWTIDLAFELKQMGFVMLATHQPAQAQIYFGQSLMTAQEQLLDNDTIFVDAVGGLAQLLAEQGDLARAYRLIYLVSRQEGIDRHFQDEQALFTRLEKEFSDSERDALHEAVQAQTIEAVVDELRAEFGVDGG